VTDQSTIEIAALWTSGRAARALGISQTHLSRLAVEQNVPFVMSPLGRLYEPAAIRGLAQLRTALSRHQSGEAPEDDARLTAAKASSESSDAATRTENGRVPATVRVAAGDNERNEQ
jgi:hypothetical protein